MIFFRPFSRIVGQSKSFASHKELNLRASDSAFRYALPLSPLIMAVQDSCCLTTQEWPQDYERVSVAQ